MLIINKFDRLHLILIVLRFNIISILLNHLFKILPFHLDII